LITKSARQLAIIINFRIAERFAQFPDSNQFVDERYLPIIIENRNLIDIVACQQFQCTLYGGARVHGEWVNQFKNVKLQVIPPNNNTTICKISQIIYELKQSKSKGINIYLFGTRN